MAGRALTEDADSEIAIMMVEAGGTEKSWSYYDAGAPKVTEEVLAEGLEASKRWIRESINLQRRLVEAYTAARGPIETIPFSTFTDYQEDVWARVEAVGTEAIAKANLVTSKAERNAALDAAGEEIRAALGDEFADRPRRGQGGHPLAHQEAGAQAHRRGGRACRRPWHQPTSGRSRPRSTCSRRPTARRSSSAARPRCST